MPDPYTRRRRWRDTGNHPGPGCLDPAPSFNQDVEAVLGEIATLRATHATQADTIERLQREYAEVVARLEAQHAAQSAARENLRGAHDAMLLIREAVETLGPAGCMRSGEYVCCHLAPTFDAEAQEIVRGIRAIHEGALRGAATDEAIRHAVSIAIDSFPGMLHSEKIDAVLAAIRTGATDAT